LSHAYDFDLVCIGSGPAGQRGAVQAAKLGMRSAVIERRRAVGGVCIDTGTIPSKTLREAVVTFSGLVGKGDRLPWARIDSRPTCEQLLAGIDTVVTREMEVIDNQLRRNDVALLRGDAAFVDPHTLTVGSTEGRREVTAANVLIACGTQPAALSGVEPDGETILTTDDIVRLKHVPRTLTVVGAGVIGMEYTSIFAALGVAVTLVERRERLLEFLDREIVEELMHQMRSRGVTFRLGEAVASIALAEGPPRKAVISLESGKRIVTDMVLLSAGRVPATATLALGTAGLSVDARGRVAVDAQFRTTVPHIFAAGDVLGYPSLAATSSEQGGSPPARPSASRRAPWPRTFPSASTRSPRSRWSESPNTC